MKSSSRKIIKSEDVKFIQASGERMSGKDHGMDSRLSQVPVTSASDRMKEGVVKKIQQAEKSAYNRGVSDGIRQGRELQKNEAFLALQAVSNIMSEVSELKKNILQNAEADIIHLAVSVAAKILHLEVTTNREVIRHLLREAIKKIVDRENMKIRIHPLDFQYMMEIKTDFLQNFDGVKNIVFEEDDSIQQGGAIIETLFGEVDARLDQQYNEIKELMTSSCCR